MDNKFNINKIKRTKLIATIGPASDSKEVLRSLFDAGMTTLRLNFSHGDHEEQLGRIEKAKEIQKEVGKPLSIMLDTKGPEIRVGKMKDGKQKISSGQKITVYSMPDDFKNKVTGQGEISVSYDMSIDLKKGDTILIDDGKLQLKVDKVKKGVIETTAFNHHIVKTNKRVNLPGVDFSLPFLAAKDIDDIRWGTKHGIDYISASFVNTASNIKEIRKILKEENDERVQVLAKIESQLGVDNIDSIIKEADGIMVARGDLGLEVPYYDVPFIQKNIIRKCRAAGKLVIVATQMLESMTDNPSPTRAEVTDVYLATESGADATMLSGESAAGTYPALTVGTMATINKRAEFEFYSKVYYSRYTSEILKTKPADKRNQIAVKVLKKALAGEYSFAIVHSTTGQLLKAVSKLRPNTNIIGVSKNEENYTAFGIWHSIQMAKPEEYAKLLSNKEYCVAIAKQWGAKKGQKVFLVRNDSITDFIVK